MSGRPQEQEPEPVETGRVARGAGAAIVRLRWLIPPAWIVGVAAAYFLLPSLSTLPGAGIDFLIPKHTAAIETAKRAIGTFGVPVLPQIAVVQRDPDGISATQQERIARLAVRLDRGRLPGFPHRAFAVPIANTARLFPGARESGTTAITYLFFPTDVSPTAQTRLAKRYAEQASVPGAPALVTGSIPGRIEQADAISSSLRTVTYATLGMIAVILGVYFRSPFAPLVPLLSAGLAYVLSLRAVTFYAQNIGSTVPKEIEPLLIVLLLGIVTDYSVFFLSGLRRRLRAGQGRREAARATTQQYLPIVLTAGLLVSGSVATLRVARLGFFQALGPAMAITVVVGVAVAITWVPALMGLFGRFLFWPGIRGDARDTEAVTDGRATVRQRLLRLGLRRPFATAVALLASAALVAAASGLFGTRLGLTPIRGLTSATSAERGAVAASKGFAPGIVAPSELVLRRRGVASERAKLARFGKLLQQEPGVAGVIGPGLVPATEPYGLLRAPGGGAARYLLVLDRPPFGAPAIDRLRNVQADVPHLLDRAGLGDARVGYTGATAVAAATVSDIYHDLELVALAAFLVNFVLLVVYTRALVAPLYLVAASALSLAATFGLATYFFQGLLGYEQLTYYVPLAVGVLLVSFGSDYNIFIVGRIYQQTSELPLREAIAEAVPKASRAITVAGLTLACSFASLAIIPVAAFREFAFATSVGILLDTFIVRTFLIPSVISAVGWGSWWPSHHGRRG